MSGVRAGGIKCDAMAAASVALRPGVHEAVERQYNLSRARTRPVAGSARLYFITQPSTPCPWNSDPKNPLGPRTGRQTMVTSRRSTPRAPYVGRRLAARRRVGAVQSPRDAGQVANRPTSATSSASGARHPPVAAGRRQLSPAIAAVSDVAPDLLNEPPLV